MKKRSISIATILLMTLCIAGCNQVRKNETTVPLSTQIETTVSPTTSPEAKNIPTTEVPTTEKVIEITYQALVTYCAAFRGMFRTKAGRVISRAKFP